MVSEQIILKTFSHDHSFWYHASTTQKQNENAKFKTVPSKNHKKGLNYDDL
jgi:hypothetical protein